MLPIVKLRMKLNVYARKSFRRYQWNRHNPNLLIRFQIMPMTRYKALGGTITIAAKIRNFFTDRET